MHPAAVTYSAWVKATSFPSAYNGVIERINADPTYTALAVKSSGKLACFVSTLGLVSYDGTGSHTLSTGTFYYLAMVYSSTVGLVGYVNAAQDGTAAANGPANTAAIAINIGRDPNAAAGYWNGVIDEARIASVARSADWITTEYNNQSAPGTFETLGTEVSTARPTPTATSTPTPTPAANSNFLFFFPR
jgi:hypothetical protein